MRQECLTQAVNFTNWEHFVCVCYKNLYVTVSHTSCQNCCQNLNWEHPNSNCENFQFNEVIFLDEDEIKQSLDCSTPIF